MDFGEPPPQKPKDHIVVAAGSGGTLAGLALALRLAGAKQQLSLGIESGEFTMDKKGIYWRTES